MSNDRRRVLFIGDTPAAATGYANIFRGLLPRLQARHNVALLACFGTSGDPRVATLPYKLYEAWPNDGGDPLAPLGKGHLERVLLDYQPDVVCLLRDVDHDSFVYRSAFRRHFRVLAMPTVDARPQKDEWVDACAQADALLSYTRFGGEVLREQVGGLAPYLGVGTPGVDFDLFQPAADREAHKRSAGLGGKFVVGTVMRNQDRKLFPDLIDAFAAFVRQAPPEVAGRAVLYLHAAHPDLDGWDLPRLTLDAGVADRTLFTYVCRSCGATYPTRWVGVPAACRACGRAAARTADVEFGVPPEGMPGVFNLFDVYCHLAYAGGLEIPILEAAACGVPVVTNDYAAMGELAGDLGAVAVPCRLTKQHGSGRLIAVPDVPAVTRALADLAAMPESVRRHRGFSQVAPCRQRYGWEAATDRWAKAISAVPPPEREWDSPPADWLDFSPPPPSATDAEFARHCLWALRANSSPGGLSELKLARDLAAGDRSAVWARVAAEVGVMSQWERERVRRLHCPSSSSATTPNPANVAKSPAAT